MGTKLSDTLKKRLHGKNISQLSRELQISKSLLSDWIAARRTPSLKNIESLQKIAAYLGMSLDELLVGKPSDGKVITALVFEDDRRSYRINIERLK